jgi:molecular chaperone HtpG
MTATADAPAPQTMEFKTELKQLLDLIIHSLYTKKEIFLRELISNAADATDKLRFEALKQPELLEGGPSSDFKIRLTPDEQAKTLTVSDDGVGMTRDQIVDHLGTIAKSGTRAFLENLKAADAQQRPELIGQFGVGFYASFMVADRVTVISRGAGTAEAVKWTSDGQGSFTVEPAERATRGTDVILHLRDDAKEFLSPWKLREIVKRYSDYIEHPVVLDVEEEKEGKKETREDVLNSRQAIWLRNKNEVKEEEYHAFYKQVSHDFDDPLKTIHIAVEGGVTDFRALLFLPKSRGFEWMAGPEKKSSVDLYVRRVLIQHECEQVIPPYMRFVKGVVDALDLPLNVSRETIQHDPRLVKIKKNLVNRVLKTLEDLKQNDADQYRTFFAEFGIYLKEGAATDFENRERLSDLILFESTRTEPGKFTDLAKYVEGMKIEQKEIYYLTGDSRELLENSPYLEAFKARGEEVLLLAEPIDEYLVSSIRDYKGKQLKPVDRGDVEDKSAEEQKKAAAEKLKGLLDTLKSKLAADVKDVRVTTRLKESAAVLVADEHAMSAHMERLMARMGRGEDVQPGKRILELNPEHPVVQAMQKIAEQNASDERIDTCGRLLYDQAVIAEGSRIKDPAGFAKRINDLLAKGL